MTNSPRSQTDGATSPIASVCIPTYEPVAEHLAQAVASAVGQGAEIEVVVCDDGSRRPPPDVTRPQVRMLLHAERVGMVQNWNRAVAASRGEFVLVLGQDDVLAEGAIDALVEHCRQASLVACGGARRFIDGQGRELARKGKVNDRSRIFVDRKAYVLEEAELVELGLRNGVVVGEQPAVLFSRAAFDALHGFDGAFGHAVDQDFILRLAGVGPIGYLAREVLQRRWHGGNATVGNLRDGTAARDRELLHRRHADRLSPAARDRVDAAFVTQLAFDVVRALGSRRTADARRGWQVIVEHLPLSSRAVRERAAELLTGRNADRR